MAKSKIKHEIQDDLEGNGYEVVNDAEQQWKHNDEFELGDLDEEEATGNASGSASSSTPSTPVNTTSRQSEDIPKEGGHSETIFEEGILGDERGE